jgi:hypothetical protein
MGNLPAYSTTAFAHRPAGAAPSQAEHGAMPRALVLDRHRRMG